MECGFSTEERDKRRYRAIASTLPYIKGTIVDEQGNAVDISEFFDLMVSDADPQLLKAKPFLPFIKDTILLQDGKTCSLLDIIHTLLNRLGDGNVYTKDLRLTYVKLTDKDWEEQENADVPSLENMDFYPHKLTEEDWKWQ